MSEATNQLLDNLNALAAGLFLLTAFGIVATRQVRGCLNLFILQSLMLAASAVFLGLRYQSAHLYGVALVNVISKPCIVPWLLRKTSPAEIYTRREIDQVLNIPTSLLIALALAILAYFLGMPLERAVGPDFRGPNVPVGVAGLLLAVRVAWLVSSGRSVTDGLGSALLNWIAVDGLSALILVLIALVATTASIFSVGYFANQNLERKRLLVYYANYNLFIFSMLAIPVMAEPTLVWIVVN
jgi:hydrogenase-4 membrane subunit HyfE